MKAQSGNFGFLEAHDVQLVRLGALAERYFHDDPNTCLIKLRQFAELLTQLIAAKTGLYEAGDESQADLLRRLRFERVLPPQVADLFHTLRKLGMRPMGWQGRSVKPLTPSNMRARPESGFTALCLSGWVTFCSFHYIISNLE